MTTVLSFQVVPNIPPELGELEEIAGNVAFDWNHRARALFSRLDEAEWEQCYYNPVRMLRRVSQERLDEAARDEGFLGEMRGVLHELREYLQKPSWYQNLPDSRKKRRFAHRLLRHGVRADGIRAQLLGRSGHPGRRPYEVGQRPGAAPHRRRPSLWPGIFPSAARPRRLAARTLPAQHVSPHAPSPRARRERRAPYGGSGLSRRTAHRADMARAGGPQPDLLHGRQHSRKRALAARNHPGALRRGHGNADSPGDTARHRRREAAPQAETSRPWSAT